MKNVRDLNQSNATVRGTVASCRLDGRNTIVFVHSRTKTQIKSRLAHQGDSRKAALFYFQIIVNAPWFSVRSKIKGRFCAVCSEEIC